jgi:hypothetical protein
MRMLMRFAILSVLLSVLFGCASSGGKQLESRLPPPAAMDRIFLKYKDLPGEKVFVVAVDRDGRWTYGYDYDRASVEEAARNAAAQCDASRKSLNIFARAKLFAVNNNVVYYNQFK